MTVEQEEVLNSLPGKEKQARIQTGARSPESRFVVQLSSGHLNWPGANFTSPRLGQAQPRPSAQTPWLEHLSFLPAKHGSSPCGSNTRKQSSHTCLKPLSPLQWPSSPQKQPQGVQLCQWQPPQHSTCWRLIPQNISMQGGCSSLQSPSLRGLGGICTQIITPDQPQAPHYHPTQPLSSSPYRGLEVPSADVSN